MIGEYDAGGVMTERYVHGRGTDNPVVWLHGPGATDIRWFYTDYHGSIIGYTDNAGNIVNYYKYGPYGEPKNASNITSFTGPRFRYTGQTVIPEAGLYYYKARVYDPIFGRFLQTDPIGSSDDLDLYAYTAGDPVNGSDPTGTQAADVPTEVTIVCPTCRAAAAIAKWYLWRNATQSEAAHPGGTEYRACHAGRCQTFLYVPPLANEAADPAVEDPSDEAVDEILDGAKPETDSRGKDKRGQYVKPEGDVQADFGKLPGTVGGNGQKTLPDGSTAGVHTSTTTGKQTLHIHRPSGKADIKVRYG